MMFKHHITDDHLRYSLKNPCLRLWTGAKHYNYVCNLYTLGLLQVLSVTGIGKLIGMLSNGGGNIHTKMQQFIGILQPLK